MGPNRVEDKEKLDEDTAEGQYSSHQDTWQGFRPKTLLGNRPGDRVGSHWVFYYMFLEAKVGTDESQWYGDSEPESHQGTKGGEGDGGRASLGPEEDVEEEHDGEHDTRTQHGSH